MAERLEGPTGFWDFCFCFSRFDGDVTSMWDKIGDVSSGWTVLIYGLKTVQLKSHKKSIS